jgi:cyclopropane fatty-acyl-phospholipid synthase-like methyltransferase
MTELVNHYKELHKDESFYADSVLTIHKESIRQQLSNKGCKTILDYGCGKGNQYHKENIHEQYFFGIMPSLYDPAVKEYSKLPKETFDAVISTDVLEHIEEQHLAKVLKEIYSKADKFVYLGICNIPAEAILPDGRNAHVTLNNLDWWLEQILPHAKVFTQVYVYGQGKSTALIENNQVTLKKIR